MSTNDTPNDIDRYIAGYPADIREKLEQIRATIRAAARESIKYNMPAYVLEGFLVSFAAYKKHIGLYPAPTGSDEFNEQLAPYRGAKSAVRLPLDKPIPYDLITQIVKLRVLENLSHADAKKNKNAVT